MNRGYKYSLIVLTFLLGLVGCHDSTGAKDNLTDDPQLIIQTKVISHIINLVDWSDDATADKTFHYCYLGQTTSDNEAYVNKYVKLDNQIIKVTHLTDMKKADGHCHAIIIDASQSAHYDDILKHFSGKPILLLSENTDFARMGGHVSLFKLKDKYAFTLNLESLEQAGFHVDLSGYPTLIAEPIDDEEYQEE